MKAITFTVLLVALAVSLMPAAFAAPMTLWGTATIYSSSYNLTPDGASVTAHINSSGTANASGKIGVGVYLGATSTAASGYWMLSVPCNAGDNVSFKINNVTALINNSLSGFTCSLDFYNTTYGSYIYLNSSLLSSGSACTSDASCITGICASDYDGSGAWCVPSGSCAHDGVRSSGYAACQDAATLETCSSGSWVATTCSCSSGACITPSGGSTPSSGSSPTPATETNITNPTSIGEIIQGITPGELGLTIMTASDVSVKQMGSTTETTVQTTASMADVAIQMVTDATAKAAIEAVKTAVAAGNDVDVKVSLTVYKVESLSTGRSVYVSKVTLSFTAANGMKDVDIVQIIPKSMAATIAEVTFTGGTPAVLQSDPVVKWSFASVRAGETKNMSYTVNKQLAGTSGITTLAAAGNITIPAPAPTPTPTPTPSPAPAGADNMMWIIIGVVVLVIILVIVYFLIRK